MEFYEIMLTTKLGYSDMVLGMLWMDIVGPITWELHNEICVQEAKTCIKRGNKITHKTFKKSHKIDKLLQQGAEADTIQLVGIHGLELICNKLGTTSTNKAKETDSLLQEFDALFKKPTALPPKRNLDHYINLQPRKGLVNVRPYYPKGCFRGTG